MIFEDDLYEGDPEKWSQPLWKTDILVGKGLPGMKAQQVAETLEELAISVFTQNLEATDGDLWSVSLTTLGRPDNDRLFALLGESGFARADMDIHSAPVEQKDWLLHVHENFPPVTAGRFFVFGSHYTGEKPAGLVPVRIDAATAFGSGEHETTKGCLLALDTLEKSGAVFSASEARGLDMGCGSGILAVAMAKLWPRMAITAVDIDPESVTVTRRHADMNDVQVTVEAGNGYQTPVARQNMPYDLIVANILAGPLVEMAGDLASALKPGGRAVLSGLLLRQGDAVADAHGRQGLKVVEKLDIGAWCTLTLEKPR